MAGRYNSDGLYSDKCVLGLGLELGLRSIMVRVVFVGTPYWTVSPFFLKSGLKAFVGIATIGILIRNRGCLRDVVLTVA